MRGGYGVAFPGARSQNVGNLLHREVNFLVAIVEVRRKANARLGAVVHQNVARQQFAHHFGGVRAFDGNGAAAFSRIGRGVHAPAAGLRTCDQARRLADGLLADARHAHLADDVEPGLAGVERRDLRGAAQKAEGVVAAVRWANFEIKRSLVREPAGEARGELRAQVGADVEIRNARAAAEPLQQDAYAKIDEESTKRTPRTAR